MARSEQCGGHGGGIQPRVKDPQYNVDGVVGLKEDLQVIQHVGFADSRVGEWESADIKDTRKGRPRSPVTFFTYLSTVTEVLGHCCPSSS